MCDKIIDAQAKLYNEETKTVTTNFIEKMQSVKHKVSYFGLSYTKILFFSNFNINKFLKDNLPPSTNVVGVFRINKIQSLKDKIISTQKSIKK